MKVRILRVLEYVFEGSDPITIAADVEKHMQQRFVKDSVSVGHHGHKLTIREAIIGNWPELLDKSEETDDGKQED
jgi:hypothetical protein